MKQDGDAKKNTVISVSNARYATFESSDVEIPEVDEMCGLEPCNVNLRSG